MQVTSPDCCGQIPGGVKYLDCRLGVLQCTTWGAKVPSGKSRYLLYMKQHFLLHPQQNRTDLMSGPTKYYAIFGIKRQATSWIALYSHLAMLRQVMDGEACILASRVTICVRSKNVSNTDSSKPKLLCCLT